MVKKVIDSLFEGGFTLLLWLPLALAGLALLRSFKPPPPIDETAAALAVAYLVYYTFKVGASLIGSFLQERTFKERNQVLIVFSSLETFLLRASLIASTSCLWALSCALIYVGLDIRWAMSAMLVVGALGTGTAIVGTTWLALALWRDRIAHLTLSSALEIVANAYLLFHRVHEGSSGRQKTYLPGRTLPSN